MGVQICAIKKVSRRLIALSLVVTLMTGVNVEILSENIYAVQRDKNEKVKSRESKTVMELANERTENSNTYLLSNGLKRTEMFPESIRFEKDGTMTDYNTEIVKPVSSDKIKLRKTMSNVNVGNYIGVNAVGHTKQYFPKDISTDGIIMINNRYSITLSPRIADGDYVAQIKDDTIKYINEKKSTIYQYTSLKNGVKEEIILNSKPDKNEFEFHVNLSNVVLKLEKGAIYLVDCKTKENVGYIMPPNITDSLENINYEDIKYEIYKSNIIKMTVKKKYFENEDLKYPVIIDPTPVWFSNKLFTAVVNSASFLAGMNLHLQNLQIENKCNNKQPYVGSQQRVYLDTKKIAEGDCFVQGPGNIKGKYIEKATLSIRENECQYTNGTVEIYKPEESFDTTTITWNNQPHISEKMIGSCEFTNVPGTVHMIDITEWARDIASGAIEDTGMVFLAKEEGTGESFNGPELSNQAYMWISITYREVEAYNASVELKAEYNAESGKIKANIIDNNASQEVKTVSRYEMYQRNNDSELFSLLDAGQDINTVAELTVGETEKLDLRTCIFYADGMVRLSNIVSFEKNTETGEYVTTTLDTDKDGLEDGYEIWDFKTYWNTEMEESSSEKIKYKQDTDGDGFPDGYEVFILGTDPALANRYDENGKEKDSDGDGLSDYEEYIKGTNSHLQDTDFDAINDLNDCGVTNPIKTDNSEISGTDSLVAYESSVYVGMYEREYSEEQDGVMYYYIKNVYSGNIKQVKIDYGKSSLNKTIKYFYDPKGNCTSIIEQYASEYDPTHEKTKCITYTYNNNNIEFICDGNMKYTMIYEDGKLKNFRIGNQEVVNYENIVNVDKNAQISTLDFGDVITSYTNKVNYQNNQNIKTKTYRYKIPEDDFSSMAFLVYVYYDSDISPSYQVQYNIEGTILKLSDYTQKIGTPITYNYTSDSDNTTVTRSDGFTKSVTKQEADDDKMHTSTTTTGYTYKDLKGNTKTKRSSIVSKIDNDNNISSTVNLYEKDRYEYSRVPDNRIVTERIHSTSKESYVLSMAQVIQDSSMITRFCTSGETDENGRFLRNDVYYTYDLAGNLTCIRENDKIINDYSYDPHGRIVEETDYKNRINYLYEYDAAGNVIKKITHILNKVEEIKEVESFEYNNNQWSNQLTGYEETQIKNNITYDSIGNPINYIDGMVLSWNRGRFLKSISNANGSEITYKYNENGYRIYKSTANLNKTEGETVAYEYDGDKLIKETNTNYLTGKEYEVWYLYDDRGNAIGYDYTYIAENNAIQTKRVYYEKDIKGSIIGLWDEKGYRFASYSYDIWGNLVNVTCNVAYSELCKVNHLEFRGYYRDNESGFSYSINGYYVPKFGRMLNSDNPFKIIEQEKNIADRYLSYNNFKELAAKSTVLPTEVDGYDVDYSVDEYVEYCDASSLLFESMNRYVTNCYGFAVNCWFYKLYRQSGMGPGMCVNNADYSMYVPCSIVAERVKQDFQYWGKEAVILTGNDNNPYYETDDEHCLIAVRTMEERNFNNHIEPDSFHFMVRKDDGWYFKSGWNVGILKLKGNNTPDTVPWSQYEYDENTNRVKCHFTSDKAFYTSDIQYMVVSKMPLQIK